MPFAIPFTVNFFFYVWYCFHSIQFVIAISVGIDIQYQIDTEINTRMRIMKPISLSIVFIFWVSLFGSVIICTIYDYMTILNCN